MNNTPDFNKDEEENESGRLGTIALKKGFITEEQLNEAILLQEQSNSLLGEILVAKGYIKPIDLYKLLSEQVNLPHGTQQLKSYIEKADYELARQFSVSDLMEQLFSPVFIENNRITVLVFDHRNFEVDRLLQKKFPGKTPNKVLATKRDIREFIERCFKNVITEEAVMGLFYRSPAESVKQTFTLPQVMFMIGLVALLALGLYLYTKVTIIGLVIFFNLLFLASIIFKFTLSLAGAYQNEKVDLDDSRPENDIEAAELPIYTVLIPVFREPAIMEQMVAGLKNLDYPLEKLDVLFLFEENDQETIEAAKKTDPPGHWHFITVPASQPQTKPKACNYGLAMARGEFLTIYDAEDVPEPDQLRKAVYAFRNKPEHYICFQAALNYFNRDRNILTRLFTLEYSYWFDYLLKGLDALGLPIPLGGTSNHFKVDKLKEIGGWDPFNVTEDADLGIRAFGRGYKVGVINSTTFEEATSKVPSWIKQRTRWQKGYLQTFLVHNRKPFSFVKNVGLKGWFTLQVFIGGSVFTNLAAPFFWALFFYWLFSRDPAISDYFYGTILYISLFNLLFGNFFGIYLSTLAVFRRENYHLTYYALLVPAYFLLQSVAAWRAFVQLFVNPYYWEKTGHGFSFKEVINSD